MKNQKTAKGVTKLHLLLFFVVLVIGIGVGAFARPLFESAAVQTQSPTFADVRQEGAQGSRLTNPLLECRELPESISIGQRIGLQGEVERIIDKYKSQGKLADAAIYFRDLNNGPWFGVSEEKKFFPASLIKVPLAMYYYWRADADPGILSQEIDFKGPRGTSIVHFPPAAPLEEGRVYTIEELLTKMLQHSDNDAAYILDGFAGSETNIVYHDLGVDTVRAGEEYAIDVRTYASFFRILYNATYLTRSLSEHMLETLTSSLFTYGIVAGVPSSIKVAHKFGEKVLDDKAPLYQLHDCGIVYAPSQPYTLCVMTQGANFDELAKFIAEVSATVYREISP